MGGRTSSILLLAGLPLSEAPRCFLEGISHAKENAFLVQKAGFQTCGLFV